MLADENQYGIRAARAQVCDQRRDRQDKLRVGFDLSFSAGRGQVQVFAQGVDMTAALRCGQWQHSAGTAKANRRLIDDTPAIFVNLDRLPVGVAQVDIDAAVEFGETRCDRTLGRIVVRTRLYDPECALHCL